MSKDKARYFELKPHVGCNRLTGEPEPLQEVGIKVGVPTMVKDGKGNPHPIIVPKTIRVKPTEPDGRTIKTDDVSIASALLECGSFIEVDAPKSEQPRKPKNTENNGGEE